MRGATSAVRSLLGRPLLRLQFAIRRAILLAIAAMVLLVAAGFGLAALGVFLAREYGVVEMLAIYGGIFLVIGLIFLVAAQRATRDLKITRAATPDLDGSDRGTADSGDSGAGPLAIALAFAIGFASAMRRRN